MGAVDAAALARSAGSCDVVGSWLQFVFRGALLRTVVSRRSRNSPYDVDNN